MRIIDDEDDALNEDNKGDEFNAESQPSIYLLLPWKIILDSKL
jgi:hypothetical protein